MFWIRGLIIFFLLTLARAQYIFYGSFSGLEVQPNPEPQDVQQGPAQAPPSYPGFFEYTLGNFNPCQP